MQMIESVQVDEARRRGERVISDKWVMWHDALLKMHIHHYMLMVSDQNNEWIVPGTIDLDFA